MSSDGTSTDKSQYQVPLDFTVKAAWLMRVLADPHLSDGAKVVATRLFHYHNQETGRCDVRQGPLAKAIGRGRQKVNEWIAELQASGWIFAHRVSGHASLYRLEVDQTESTSMAKRAKRAQPTTRRLSSLPDNGLSPVPDNGCPTAATTVVASPGQGVVATTGHRTDKGNYPSNSPRYNPPQTKATATVIPMRQLAPGREDGREDQPDYAIINGARIPNALMTEWIDTYRSIQVRPAVNSLTSWMRDKRVPEERHIATIISTLSKKNEEADRADRRDRIQAEAKAKYDAAKEKPRPAI